MSTQLILASQSPRRVDLLGQIGVPFIQYPSDVDETPQYNEPPFEYVWRMAESKAKAVWQNVNDGELGEQFDRPVVLGADTICEINGEVLVKPDGFEDFARMMKLMSEDIHKVHTALALRYEDRLESRVVTVEVEFGVVSDQDIEWYWNTGEPLDKAGGYAIQGIGGQFVKKVQGSCSAVVGLPLYETVKMLKKAGICVNECRVTN